MTPRPWLVALALLPAWAQPSPAETLPACPGMRAEARPARGSGPAPEGLWHEAQGGRLLLAVALPSAYFSQEFGVILEDRAGRACRVPLATAEMRGLAVTGPGAWRAVEAGLCDTGEGACTPVRIEFPAALQTRPRP